MLDIGWTELLVIAIVLIVIVGPKDLPPMIRAFGKMTANLRKMAGDFRTQFDEALKESELDDVRNTISDAQRLNPTNALRDAINPLRQMGQEIKSDLQKATQMPSKTDIEAQKAVEGAPETRPEVAVSVPAATMTLPSEPPVVAAPAPVAASAPAAAPAPASAPVQAAPVVADAVPAKPKPVRKPAAPKATTKAAAAEPTPAAVTARPTRAPAPKGAAQSAVADAASADVAMTKAPARKRVVKKAEEPKGEA